MDKAYKIYRENGAMSHLVGNESTVLPRSRSLDPGPFFDLALEAKTMAVRCARHVQYGVLVMALVLAMVEVL